MVYVSKANSWCKDISRTRQAKDRSHSWATSVRDDPRSKIADWGRDVGDERQGEQVSNRARHIGILTETRGASRCPQTKD